MPLTTYKLQYLHRNETNNKQLKVNLRIITQKLTRVDKGNTIIFMYENDYKRKI